jgi:hypothetical protein
LTLVEASKNSSLFLLGLRHNSKVERGGSYSLAVVGLVGAWGIPGKVLLGEGSNSVLTQGGNFLLRWWISGRSFGVNRSMAANDEHRKCTRGFELL